MTHEVFDPASCWIKAKYLMIATRWQDQQVQD